MKRFFLILAILFFAGGVYANEPLEGIDCSSNLAKALINQCEQDTQQHKAEFGAGLDLVLYEDQNIVLTEEYRYDWSNNNHQAYTVAKTRLSTIWNAIKKIIPGGDE